MSSSVHKRAVLRRGAVSVVLLAGFLIAHYNWRNPVLRFDAPLANRIFLLGAFALPAVALVVIWPTTRRWTRLGLVVVMLPVLVYTAVVGGLFTVDTLMDAPDLAHGRDSAFDPIRSQDIGSSRLVLYRTNCGATCAWGLRLRQERPLAPGILLVRDLASWYRAYDAALEPQAGGAVLIRVPPDSSEVAPMPRDRTVQPLGWVYF